MRASALPDRTSFPTHPHAVLPQIKGMEVTHIRQDVVVTHVDHHHDRNHHSYTDVHTDVQTQSRQVQTVFYKDGQQLHRWQPKEVVQPGQYQWRFAGFHLPTNAKPSSNYQSNDRTLGAPGMGGSVRSSVSYKVKAVVRRPGAFTANLRGTTELTVLPGYIGAIPGGGTAVVVVQQPQPAPVPVPVPGGYAPQPMPAPGYPQPGAYPAPQQPQQPQQPQYAPYPTAGAMPQAPAGYPPAVGYPGAAPAAPPAPYGVGAPLPQAIKA